MNLFEAINLLANRPECEHGFNGPCRDCGPGLNLEEAATWRDELKSLGIEPTVYLDAS
jgi:hypothetical protein